MLPLFGLFHKDLSHLHGTLINAVDSPEELQDELANMILMEDGTINGELLKPVIPFAEIVSLFDSPNRPALDIVQINVGFID